MKQLKFKCELLTDVILNQKAASEGANQTLDFIPGSNFLGIVAGKIYKAKSKESLDIFHSGKVRFGDAHPANGENRALRMPAALYFPKGQPEKDRQHYVHHEIVNPSSEDLRKIQLKQERSGYADFTGVSEGEGTAIRFKVDTDFAIKSAYDRIHRRSQDEQMFGYQSMGKGMVYYFTVEIDDEQEQYANSIKKALIGTKRIGRSRSAQYGLVDITEYDGFKEVQSGKACEDNLLIIYAESRLIFLDDNGQPTFQPSFEQLVGRKETDKDVEKILWDKSQLRTFQYAPYNYQRRCFDTDRCGIEKGSVIVVHLKDKIDINELPTHLGSYLNEGFGKVIYNPNFLAAQPSTNGLLAYKILPREDAKLQSVEKPQSKLVDFLVHKKEEKDESASIYTAVNGWINNSEKIRMFTAESFASQWGQIRNIALQCEMILRNEGETNEKFMERKMDELYNKLFRTKDEQGRELQEKDKGYLVHGVAKDKWAGKTSELRKFVESQHSPKAVVNLASEMQKRCN